MTDDPGILSTRARPTPSPISPAPMMQTSYLIPGLQYEVAPTQILGSLKPDFSTT